MKKNFSNPELKIYVMNIEDVITTSGGSGVIDPNPNQGENEGDRV